MTAQRLRLRYGMMASRFAAAFAKGEHEEDADFAKLHELERLMGNRIDRPALNTGIGPYYYPLRVEPTPQHRELGNILFDCRSRGGKGLAGQSQALTWTEEGSLIINDIKQWEYWDKTAGYRNRYSRVIRFDPTDPNTRCYDPTAGKTTEHQLYKIAKYLLFDPKDNQPVFTDRAIKMFTQMLLGAVAEGEPRFPYISDMVNFGPQYTAAKLHAIPGVGPTLARKFLDADYEKADWNGKFFNDCWGTLSAKLYPLTLANVVHSLSKSDFTPEEIIRGRHPVTLYLCWPESDLDAPHPVIRLVYSTLFDGMIDAYDEARGKGCRETLFLFDEAGRCPVPRLPHYTSTVAGRKISFWMGFQDTSQMEELYGAHGAKTILGNVDTFVRYRPASASMENAQAIEHHLGPKTKLVHSHTNHEGHETQGTSERSGPLMTFHQIRKLEDDEIIAFHRNLSPIKAKRMDWRHFPELVARTKIPPPSLVRGQANMKMPEEPVLP